MNTQNKSKKSLKIIALAACTSLILPLSFTPIYAAESCDTTIETQQKNRAVLAAQRENVIEQKEHTNTGSTMEWSCFDKVTAEHTDYRKNIFSEGTSHIGQNVSFNFSPPGGFSLPSFPSSMPLSFTLPSGFSETAITGGVVNGLQSYISDGFSSSILNGISGFTGGLTGGQGECQTMKNAADLARASKITDNLPIPSLEDLTSTDPREGGTGTGITQAQINQTNQNKGETPPNYRVDYLSADSDCGTPVLTKVQKTERIATGRVATVVTYNDGECFVPGCVYKVINKVNGATGICTR